jgi:sphingomyelin phosphodiesterase 4
MNRQAKKTFYEQFSVAFSKPQLWEKCRELSRILPTATSNELHVVFSQLCGDIFGYSAGGVGYGWNLASLCRTSSSGISGLSHNYRDFHASLSFLGSSGPFWDVIHRLMPGHLYEFPVSQLPPNSSKNLASQSSVALTAFEYYLYHFASLLVRRQRQNLAPTNINVNSASDTLFPLLFEDYLACFLPIDPALQSKLFTQPFHPTTASSQQQQTASQSTLSTTTSTRPSLFRKDFSPRFKLDEPRQDLRMRAQETNNTSPSSNETWRSDTLVKIIVMFWIEGYAGDEGGLNDSLNNSGGGMDYVSASLRVASTLPSAELMRVVRMFIKHAHYFANVCQQGSVFLPATMKVDIFGTRMNKALLLAFLARSIDHWPYDASFRLVLETWLSYVQPWRYLCLNDTEDVEAASKMDSVKFSPFIGDNYMFYTNLLAKVLRRFQRLDLGSSKNAFMLFRVFKVFAQDNLFACIKNVAVSQGYGLQQAKESQDIFSPEFKDLMAQLMLTALNSINTEKKRQIAANDGKSNNKTTGQTAAGLGSILTSIADFINGGSTSGSSDSETAESEKTIQHLTYVTEKVADIFDLSDIIVDFKASTAADLCTNPNNLDSIAAAADETDCLAFGLSPIQRRGLLYKRFKPDGKYRGNPDLLPIRSDEVAFLVRLLHKISVRINTKWAGKIEDFYNRGDFFGSIFREVAMGPTTYWAHIDQLDSSLNQSRNTSIHGQAKQGVKLAPRIVLRPLGSHMAVTYLFVFFLLSTMLFGKSWIGSALVLLFMTVLFFGTKALLSPSPIEPPTQDQSLLLLSECFS